MTMLWKRDIQVCQEFSHILMQVLYRMYDEAQLKPLLDAANKEVAKEKEEES